MICAQRYNFFFNNVYLSAKIVFSGCFAGLFLRCFPHIV